MLKVERLHFAAAGIALLLLLTPSLSLAQEQMEDNYYHPFISDEDLIVEGVRLDEEIYLNDLADGQALAEELDLLAEEGMDYDLFSDGDSYNRSNVVDPCNPLKPGTKVLLTDVSADGRRGCGHCIKLHHTWKDSTIAKLLGDPKKPNNGWCYWNFQDHNGAYPPGFSQGTIGGMPSVHQINTNGSHSSLANGFYQTRNDPTNSNPADRKERGPMQPGQQKR